MQEAELIVDTLVECVFSRLGVLAELHADQGTNFESNILQKICKRLHIWKTCTTAFRLQSDGQTEQQNHILLSGLSKICKEQAK